MGYLNSDITLKSQRAHIGPTILSSKVFFYVGAFLFGDPQESLWETILSLSQTQSLNGIMG